MGKLILDELTIVEQSAAPSNPPSGYQHIYAKTDGKFYAKNASGVETEMTNTLAGGGQTENFNWKFDTTTGAADPGAGYFRFNNATPASVTNIYVDDLCDITGFDISSLFNSLVGSYSIYIQQTDDATKFVQFDTTAPWTDNTGWFTIPVTFIQVGSGGLFGNNKKCTWYIINKNTSGTDTNFVNTDLTFTVNRNHSLGSNFGFSFTSGDADFPSIYEFKKEEILLRTDCTIMFTPTSNNAEFSIYSDATESYATLSAFEADPILYSTSILLNTPSNKGSIVLSANNSIDILGTTQVELSSASILLGVSAATLQMSTTNSIFESVFASTNTVETVLGIRRVTTGVAAAGIGGALDIQVENPLAVNKIATRLSGTLLNNVDSRVALSTLNNDVLEEQLRITNLGAIQFLKYGSGSFTGTAAYNLAINSSGDVIEVAPGGGSGLTQPEVMKRISLRF